MAHINSIGAGMFSDLSVKTTALTSIEQTNFSAMNAAALALWFDGAPLEEFTRIRNVREFPSIGTPPNLVNVPVYGSATSQQIQGQADPTNLELTLNYIPADWAAGTTLGNMVGSGNVHCFRFTLLNSEPYDYTSTGAGLGSVQNTSYFWMGKIEALLVNPQLTDANTATLTLSIQSAFLGAFTVTA
jgi:hypothetical protein